MTRLKEILDNLSAIEREWGDDPQTQDVRAALFSSLESGQSVALSGVADWGDVEDYYPDDDEADARLVAWECSRAAWEEALDELQVELDALCAGSQRDRDAAAYSLVEVHP